MKLRYQFVTNEVAGNMIAVAAGEGMERFSGFVKMDQTGAEIFGLLAEETTVDEMVATLQKTHDDPESEIRETVEAIVARLRQDDLIED